METKFAAWLRKRGESHSAYALRIGMNKMRVALLAGIARQAQPIARFHYPSLARISEDTGIPIQILIDDAVEASKNPIAPRQYNRKGTEDGKGTQAAE